MVVTYSDLFLVSFIPLIIQIIAGSYVVKLHCVLGRHITTLFYGINGAMIWFDTTLIAQFYNASTSPGNAPVEAWGIIAGFIIPTAVAALLFLLQKELRDALLPGNNNGNGGLNHK